MSVSSETRAVGRVAARLEFNVLGPVTVVDGDDFVDIGGPKQRAVLGILLANVGNPVSNDVIAEDLYGDDAPDRGRRRVQTYVSTLRSTLGEVIAREGGGWALRIGRERVDALRFEDVYEAVRADDGLAPETAGGLLREALAMWRGHPYSDVESHGLLGPEITRLLELRLAAQIARIDADLASGRHDDLIGEIEALIVQHPYQERLRAQHMLALYRAGRQREALGSYQQLRQVLVDELGVDPTPDLRDLEQRILEQDSSLDLAPRRRIERRAILVADLGDPLQLARLPMSDRDGRLTRAATIINAVVGEAKPGRLVTAGMASYVVLDSVASALSTAVRLTESASEPEMRVAVDFGDIQVADTGVSGVPVTRAAVLVAVANPGQVLISSEAQHALLSTEGSAGLRFESLGTFKLSGITDPTPIYQLLVDPARSFPPLDPTRIPPPVPDGGARAVPGYELREQIGTGSLGPIYRAYQPAVGREVMVEVVGRGEASDPEFIRSFEAEAHRLALLDHPNVNALLDYWREPSGAFLVYRHHRGGFLSDAEVEDPARLIAQIGSALEYAHSYGVVHGSVRPDRIVLDESGNGYLMGFPVAHPPAQSSPDYPAYIAPETLTGEKPTTATDVFALGILAHELIEGGPLQVDSPIRPTSRAGVRAVSERPEDRYQSVADFLCELIPDGDHSGTGYTELRNPYKGLVPFSESDSGDFFGRSAIVEELIGLLRRSRFVSVVGPSGIGKSSVVRAGLVPALRRGEIEGSERWVITDMMPGSQPFNELSRALERVTLDMPVTLRELLAEGDPEALAGLSELLPESSELLIVIDQFEELFTMTREATAARFLDLLIRTVEANRARIVVTLRADFLDRPLLYSQFGELLRESMIALRSPNAAELGEAIVKPAEGVGVGFDPAVVQRMISEVHDRPGALPLLQDALFELFDSRTTDTLDLDVYETAGGVTGATAKRAEAVYAGLGPEDQAIVQQALLRMVTLTDDSAPTRRRIRLSDLDDLGGAGVVDALVRNRLLVLDSDPVTRAPTVELAHETLLSHWPRLASWVENVREDLALSRRLSEAVDEWEVSGRQRQYLLTGARLGQHQSWSSTTSLSLGEREVEFLAASARHDDQARARSRRRRGWIMGGFAAAALVAGAFGIDARQNARTAAAEGMASNAVLSLSTDPELAVLLAAEAHHRAPLASTESALHRAFQAQRTLMVIPPPVEGGAWGILNAAGERVAVMGLDSARLQMWELRGNEPLWEVTLTGDQKAGFRRFAHFWFSADGGRVYVPLSTEGSEDGEGIGLYTVDASTGEVVDFLRFPCLLRAMPAGGYFAQSGALWAFDWAAPGPDSACGRGGGAGLVDITTGEIRYEVSGYTGFRPPSVSADGRFLALIGQFGRNETIRAKVFDTREGRVVFEFESPLEGGGHAVLSGDGSRILVGQSPSYLYDVSTGERLQTYQGNLVRIHFTPDEQRVYGTGLSGAIQVFDSLSGEELLELRGHTSFVGNAAVDLGGTVLVSSSFDSARIWDIASAIRSELGPVGLPPMDGGQFMEDALVTSERYLMVRRANFGGFESLPFVGVRPYQVDILRNDDDSLISTMEVWHAQLGDGDVLFVQPIEETGVTTPSGVAGAVRVGRPRLVDPASGEVIVDLDACDWFWVDEGGVEPGNSCETGIPYFINVAFSADGSTVLAMTPDGATVIWDTATGEVLRVIELDQWVGPAFVDLGVPPVLFPDGSMLITPPATDEVQAFLRGAGDPPALRVRKADTGAEVGVVNGHVAHPQSSLHIFEYHSQADRFVGAGNILLVIDPHTLEATTLPRSQGANIDDVAVSPDGSLVATAGRDGFIVVWDLRRGAIVAEIPVDGSTPNGLRGVAFEDDETLIVAPALGDVLLRFTIDSELLVSLVLDSLTRSFRPEECATYHIDPCPTLDEMRARY